MENSQLHADSRRPSHDPWQNEYSPYIARIGCLMLRMTSDVRPSGNWNSALALVESSKRSQVFAFRVPPFQPAKGTKVQSPPMARRGCTTALCASFSSNV